MAKNDVIETSVVVLSNNSLPVSRQDLEAQGEKRKILREFVSKQLKQGSDSDGDYAVIKGTNKPTLLKPGAEKLCQLFGLRTEVVQTNQIIDHNGNFAMFFYKATVFHIRSGEKIAECEASCNSKEKKYATRTAWVKNEKTTEETPIYDIMNTLMKMAQKRAVVGAVIQATGASDFFTQDLDDEKEAEAVGAKTSTDKADLGAQPSSVSFYVAGETMAHKDTIKSMGAKWNMNEKRWEFKDSTSDLFNKINSIEGLEAKRL
jgi:hypothetical protein